MGTSLLTRELTLQWATFKIQDEVEDEVKNELVAETTRLTLRGLWSSWGV